MNVGTIICILIVAILFILAVRYVLNNDMPCCGNCANCSSCKKRR